MKIKLILIGKTDNDYLKTGVEEYVKRLTHYIGFEMIVVPDLKNTKKLSIQQQKQKEGELITKHIQPGDHVVLLDENGKEFSSPEFAAFIEKQSLNGLKTLVFVVGGPYGFSEELYKIGNRKIALSRMTFSHQMVRLIFLEQLYRAMTIIKGEPYHHN